MKKIALLMTIFSLLGAVAAFAQAPDLSGEWKLNPGRSELGELASMNPDISYSIRQDAAAISIRKSVSFTEKQYVKNFRFTLDGKESLNSGESLKGLKGTAVFEKGILTVRAEQEGAKMTMSGGAEPEIEYFKYDSVEEYSLSADGKTLTVVQNGQMPDGPRKTTFVFDKVGA